MIRTQTILRCDGCRLAWPRLLETANSTRLDASVDLLREDASKKGWRRYRATPAGPIGDYCPDCAAAHNEIKVRKAAPKKTRKGPAA